MRGPSRTYSLLIISSFLFCVLLVTDWLPWLRGDVPWLPGDTGWRWPYELPRWIWVIPCIVGVAFYTFGALRLLGDDDTEKGRYPVRLILWSFVGAVLLPLLLMTMEGTPLFLLFTRSVSTVTGGYQYSATLVTNLNDVLRHWTDFILTYRDKEPLGGIALSPPGLVAAFDASARFFEAVPGIAQAFGTILRPLECQNLSLMTWSDAQLASALPQMLMPLWTALAVAPLYRLGTYVFDQRAARLAVLLWPLIPGLDMFSPRFNTFYALLALVMLVALWRGLAFGKWQWIFIAGFIMSVATFINVSLVPLGLLAGLLIIGHWALSGIRLERIGIPIRNLAWYGLGTASVWIVYTGLTGITIIDVYQLGLSAHFIMDRPYVPWLFMHPYDMFLFVGLPIAFLAIVRMLNARQWTSANVFAIACGSALLIMVLSGTARGETGRVWLFFAPCWLLLAADWLAHFTLPQQKTIFILESACLLCMAAVLRVNFTALTVPETLPTTSVPATYPVNAQFVQGSDRFTLVGLSVDRAPHQVVLHLHWRTSAFVDGPYVFSLLSIAPDQSTQNDLTWEPLGWKTPSPPSCWIPQQELVDDVTVPLGTDSKPGAWNFSLSVLDAYTHKPMQVIGADGQVSTQVGIGPVSVPVE